MDRLRRLLSIGALAAALTVAAASSALAKPKVLVCDTTVNGIITALKGSGAFDVVDEAFCESAMLPTQFAQVKSYDAVLVVKDTAGAKFGDPVALGDALATYFDGGGVVVVAMDALAAGNDLTGKWATSGYGCIGASAAAGKVSSVAMPVDPSHPLFAGVTGTITPGTHATGALNAKWGASSLWDLTDGSSLVCQMNVNGRPRVDLNVYPNNGAYSETVAGATIRLVTNALLYAKGTFGAFKAAPSSLVFPDTGTGASSAALTVTLTNASMAAATVTGITLGGANPGDFQITSAPQLPITVAAGATLGVSVSFTPQTAGARSAALKLAVQGQTSTQDVALGGTGIGAKLVVTPSPLNLGGAPKVGVALTGKLKVANVGGGSLAVKAVDVTSGAEAFSVSSVPMLPINVTAGASFEVGITFVAVVNGVTKGEVTITTSDVNAPTLKVTLVGSAGPAQISLDTGSLAFPKVNVGGAFMQDISVGNSGFATLSVSALTLGGAHPGDFKVGSPDLPGTILPGGSKTVTVSFAPTVAGDRSATLTIASDDPASPTKVVNLYGTATVATIAVAPKMIDFGAVKSGTSSQAQAFTVSNGGNGTLTVSKVELAGPQASSFAQVSGGSQITVAPGGSQMLGYLCKPLASGTLAATVTLTSDAGSATVTLACTGVAPLISVTPPQVAFGDVPQGSASPPAAITIANGGTGDLTVSGIVVGGPDGADFVAGDVPKLPVIVAKGQSVVVHVVFQPTQHGAEAATLTVISDDPKLPTVAVPLGGRGVVPGLALDVSTLDLGTVRAGKTATGMVKVTNTGDGALAIAKLALDGPDAATFSVAPDAPLTVAPGASQALTVTFAPHAVGVAQAMLTVKPAAGSVPPATVTLRGAGVSPMVSVTPTSLDFGTAKIGAMVGPMPVTLRNTGTIPFAITSVASSDPSVLVDDKGLKKMLAPGDSTTFGVTFAPVRAGMIAAQVKVTLEGDAMPAVTVAATGQGFALPPGSGGCSVAATPAARSMPSPGLAALALVVGALALGLGRRRRAARCRLT